MPKHDIRPEMLEILVMGENLETLAKSLSGSEGSDGIDSSSMPAILLKNGGSISELRELTATFGTWLTNGKPLWATCGDLTWAMLIEPDKCPKVRQVGVGSALRRLGCDVLFPVTHFKVSCSCGADQLSEVFETFIAGGIHFTCSL